MRIGTLYYITVNVSFDSVKLSIQIRKRSKQLYVVIKGNHVRVICAHFISRRLEIKIIPRTYDF